MTKVITQENGIKKVHVEMRAYIHWNGRWRHVYILSSMDQTIILGTVVRMLEFKLTKDSKSSLIAEKSKFHKTKPSARSKGGVAA